MLGRICLDARALMQPTNFSGDRRTGHIHILPRVSTPCHTTHHMQTSCLNVQAIGCITSDSSTGRIFMGRERWVHHELKYFDEDTSWLGSPQKCTRSTVRSPVSSWLPTSLRKISQARRLSAAHVLWLSSGTVVCCCGRTLHGMSCVQDSHTWLVLPFPSSFVGNKPWQQLRQ